MGWIPDISGTPTSGGAESAPASAGGIGLGFTGCLMVGLAIGAGPGVVAANLGAHRTTRLEQAVSMMTKPNACLSERFIRPGYQMAGLGQAWRSVQAALASTPRSNPRARPLQCRNAHRELASLPAPVSDSGTHTAGCIGGS